MFVNILIIGYDGSTDKEWILTVLSFTILEFIMIGGI